MSKQVVRRDAIVRPATVRATAQVGSVTITMTHHAWLTWSDIAIRHEDLAKKARASSDVMEFRPGLVALSSSAFALDALYGVAKRLIPDPGALGDRGSKVGERLKRGVSPGRLAAAWPRQMRALFKERREAVHFDEVARSPVWHQTLASNVDPLVLLWGSDTATAAVDLLLDVLTKWADHPNQYTAAWASDYKPAVQALQNLRN